MNKEQLLSVKINNILTVLLGIPILALGIAGFFSPIVSEFWDFVAIAVLGAVY